MKQAKFAFLTVAAFTIGIALAACSSSPTAPTAPIVPGVSGEWLWSRPVPPGGSPVAFAMQLTDSAPMASAAGISGSGVLAGNAYTVTGTRNGAALLLHLVIRNQGAADLSATQSGNTLAGTISGQGFNGVDSVGFARK
jgi:hypothetical protein